MSRMDSSLDNRNRQDFFSDLDILFDKFSANGNKSGEQLQAGELGSDAGCMADDVRQRQRKTFSEMSGAMIDHRRLFSLNLSSLWSPVDDDSVTGYHLPASIANRGTSCAADHSPETG